MSVCQIEERLAGRSYPRTCPKCKLGTCAKGLDQKQLIARVEALQAQLAERAQEIDTQVAALVEAVWLEYADSLESKWTFRKEHVDNAIRRTLATW
jgi:hypothetical protein